MLSSERLGDFLKAGKLAAHLHPVTSHPGSLKCHHLTLCVRAFLDHRKDIGFLFSEESEKIFRPDFCVSGSELGCGGERECRSAFA